jgi:chromosome segregation ATPase
MSRMAEAKGLAVAAMGFATSAAASFLYSVDWARVAFAITTFAGGIGTAYGLIYFAVASAKTKRFVAEEEAKTKAFLERTEAEAKAKAADLAAFRERSRVQRRERTEDERQAIKLQLAREAANHESLAEKIKALEAKLADRDHAIEQLQTDAIRAQNREIELERLNAKLIYRLEGVEGKVDRVEVRADANSAKIQTLESGPQPAVEGGASSK